MVSSRKVLQTALLVLRVLLVLVLLGVPPAADSAANKVTICIKNCAQCKLMYHDHFKGGLCAEFCLQVEGRFIPDCANPQDLIPFFLERLEWLSMAESRLPFNPLASHPPTHPPLFRALLGYDTGWCSLTFDDPRRLKLLVRDHSGEIYCDILSRLLTPMVCRVSMRQERAPVWIHCHPLPVVYIALSLSFLWQFTLLIPFIYATVRRHHVRNIHKS